MDWLTFASKAIDSLAWPITVIVALFLFRQKFRHLISYITELSLTKGGVHLRFAQEIAKAREEADTAGISLPSSDQVSPETFSAGLSEPDTISGIIKTFPNIGIALSWQEAERAIGLLTEKHPHLRGHRLHFVGAVGWPMLTGIVDDKTIDLGRRLERIAHSAAHSPTMQITEDEVVEFRKLARGVAERIRDIAEKTG